MRNTQYRLPATSVFTSKRFVVALCGAIAMVLGAMSVGSNTQSEYEDPAVTAPPSMSNRAGVLVQNNTGGLYQAESTKPLARSYFSYHTPAPLTPASSGSGLPVTNTPTKNLEIKLNLKSPEAAVTAPSTVLLKVSEPLPKATISTSTEPAAAAAKPPLQGTGTAAADTPAQTVEPNPESALDATSQ